MIQEQCVNDLNLLMIAKQMDKISLYNGKGKIQSFHLSDKTDYKELLQGLDLDILDNQKQQFEQEEQQFLEHGNLDGAEQANLKLQLLKEKEIILKNFILMEQHQREINQVNENREQLLGEFQQRWEKNIEEVKNWCREMEQELIERQENDLLQFDEDVQNYDYLQDAKYSSRFLNDQFKLKQIIKQRNYEKAKILRDRLAQEEQRIKKKMFEKFQIRVQKKREQILKEQAKERQILLDKIDSITNKNIQKRMDEYELLLKKIKNQEQEVLSYQALNFSRLQAINAKLLSKYQLNLKNFTKKHFNENGQYMKNSNYDHLYNYSQNLHQDQQNEQQLKTRNEQIFEPQIEEDDYEEEDQQFERSQLNIEDSDSISSETSYISDESEVVEEMEFDLASQLQNRIHVNQFNKFNFLKGFYQNLVSLVMQQQFKTNQTLIGVIGDQDTVTGFLLAGIGDKNQKGETNYLIVDAETKPEEVEETFNRFLTQENC